MEVLGLYDHCDIIKYPMDTSTIKSKLEVGQYHYAQKFSAKIWLMYSNCYKPSSPRGGAMAGKLQDVAKMCSAKMSEEPKKSAVPLSFPVRPSPTKAVTSSSSSDSSSDNSSENDDSSSDTSKKEVAPEVLEFQEQFQVVEEQLEAVSQAKKDEAEEEEKDKKEIKEEKNEEKEEVEESKKSKGKEFPSQNTKENNSSNSKINKKGPVPMKSQPPPVYKSEVEDKCKSMSYEEKC